MRINVYSQELTKEVKIVSKTSDSGVTHFGVRIFFDGSPRLHNEPYDDDRSAITYWIPNGETFTAGDLADVFLEAASLTLNLWDSEAEGLLRAAREHIRLMDEYGAGEPDEEVVDLSQDVQAPPASSGPGSPTRAERLRNVSVDAWKKAAGLPNTEDSQR